MLSLHCLPGVRAELCMEVVGVSFVSFRSFLFPFLRSWVGGGGGAGRGEGSLLTVLFGVRACGSL